MLSFKIFPKSYDALLTKNNGYFCNLSASSGMNLRLAMYFFYPETRELLVASLRTLLESVISLQDRYPHTVYVLCGVKLIIPLCFNGCVSVLDCKLCLIY